MTEGAATIALITLGGTISSEAAGADPASGVVPRHGAAVFADEIAPWLDGVTILPITAATVPSPSLRLGDVVGLAARIRELASGPDAVDGVVVSQGTDTIEETAFALDVLLAAAGCTLPVAVTGAMRARTAPSPDGAANLVAAIDAVVGLARAASGHLGAAGPGVVVVFADRVHAARWVSKRSSHVVDAFSSEPLGPIGRIVERRLALETVPRPRPAVPALAALLDRAGSGADARFSLVALIGTGLEDDLALLPALPGLGYAGAVVDGMGGGHVAAIALDAVSAALGASPASLPIVVTSRTGSGPALRTSYGYPGGDVDLLARGVIPGGSLSGVTARVLLVLLRTAGLAGEDLREAFAAIAE